MHAASTLAVNGMKVLLEFEGSKRVLHLSEVDSLLARVEQEVTKLVTDVAVAPFNRENLCSSKPLLVIQRWSTEWNTYIDVTDAVEVVDGDKLTLAKISPRLSEEAGPSSVCTIMYNYYHK